MSNQKNNTAQYPEPLLGLNQDKKPFHVTEIWASELNPSEKLANFGATGVLAVVRVIEVIEKFDAEDDFSRDDCIEAIRNILMSDGDFQAKLKQAIS